MKNQMIHKEENTVRKLKLCVSIPDDGGGISELFKAFFREYAKENVFRIENKKLFFEYSFEKLPEQIINAIASLSFPCIEELVIEKYPEESKDQSEQEKQEKQEKQEDVVTEETQETDSVLTEEEPKAAAMPEEEKKEAVQKGEMDDIGRKFFEEIAHKSDSFEKFVMELGSTLKVSKNNSGFFRTMLYTAVKLNSSDMVKIREEMEENDEYSNSRRITCSQLVKKAFEARGSSVRMKTFIEYVIRYKDYDFPWQKFHTPQEKTEKSEEQNSENTAEDENKPKFEFLPQSITDKAMAEAHDFFDKAKIVMDAICLACEKSSSAIVYTNNKAFFLYAITSVARDQNSWSLEEKIREEFEKRVGESAHAHILIAAFYSLIEEYAFLVGYLKDRCIECAQGFFNDLRKLM